MRAGGRQGRCRGWGRAGRQDNEEKRERDRERDTHVPGAASRERRERRERLQLAWDSATRATRAPNPCSFSSMPS